MSGAGPANASGGASRAGGEVGPAVADTAVGVEAARSRQAPDAGTRSLAGPPSDLTTIPRWAVGESVLVQRCGAGENCCDDCRAQGPGDFTVSSPGDADEVEARHIASQVLDAVPAGPAVPRVDSARVARAGDGVPPRAAPAHPLAGLGAGEPLPAGTREMLRPQLAVDTRDVRIHHGALADRRACELGARAYTVGHHVVFARGRYDPHSRAGLELLAHELVHVGQASGGARVRRDAGVDAAAQNTSPDQDTPTAAAPSGGLLVEDDAAAAGGQARKSDFLAQLREEVCTAANAILEPAGRSTNGCPFLDHWFAYLARQSSSHIERAVGVYAPETAGATDAGQYIAPIVTRVGDGVRTWLKTGQVTGVPSGLGPSAAGADGASAEQGTAAEQGEGEGVRVQAAGARGEVVAPAPAGGPRSVLARLGRGTSLDVGTRGRMESVLGGDFSGVRVHTNAAAADLSAGFNARAFTVGQDMAFASGEYQPGTPLGDALIAHELAHVVQQATTSPGRSPANDEGHTTAALEEDADRSAIGVLGVLWGNATGAVRDVAVNAAPRLRSGLRLGRCVQTGGGISASAFNFEQVTGGGDPNDRSLPWYAACVNITISHLSTAPRMDICQFEVGYPGIHRLGRTGVGTAQSAAAEAFNECVPQLLRSRSASCATIAARVQRRMRVQIPGVIVNSPCITKMLKITDWPTRH